MGDGGSTGRVRIVECDPAPPPILADISTGNSTHVDINITYALLAAAYLIVAMRRAHVAQSEVECADLRLGSAVLVRRELQSLGALPKN